MDRKALIREYKESRRPMGVYRVYNTVKRQVIHWHEQRPPIYA